MDSMRAVEYMAFPRLCASAEVVWSNRTDPVAEYEDFRAHLAVQLARLDALGVAYRPPAMADRAAARRAGHGKPPTDTPRLAELTARLSPTRPPR